MTQPLIECQGVSDLGGVPQNCVLNFSVFPFNLYKAEMIHPPRVQVHNDSWCRNGLLLKCDIGILRSEVSAPKSSVNPRKNLN